MKYAKFIPAIVGALLLVCVNAALSKVLADDSKPTLCVGKYQSEAEAVTGER